ncbi:MAG: fatty acid desaturase [Chloroflexota bacterium]
MLRYKADLKTLLWLLLIVSLLIIQWTAESFNGWVYALYLYLSVSVAVIVHNHNHVRMWKNRRLNFLTDIVLTLFYGYPVFAWIPTHNRNHHKHNNKEPDYTRTWRYWENNNLLTVLSYPLISAYHQQLPIQNYLRQLSARNRRQYLLCLAQFAALFCWIGLALFFDWRKALILIVLPQQVSLSTVLIINYIQHVHADEEDEYNHSRNFTGWLFNFLAFNNGYHTVHHMRPGLHWSQTPQAHAEIEARIDPALNEVSLAWYLIRVYVLGLLFPKLRTNSMRLDRMRLERN